MGLLRGQRFKISFCFLLLLLLYSTVTASAESYQDPSVLNTIRGDYQHYFSRRRLLRMGIIFGGCALLANTSIDEDLQSRYQNHLRDLKTDDVASWVKPFGDGRYLIPLSVVAASTGYLLPSRGTVSLISRWGRLTARAYLIGGPAMLLMQRLTGASRPGEREEGSRWNPLKDENGVSGHAFIGAVPLLTLARMSDDSIPLKSLFYVLSALPAWSRVNDNRHYPSQILLGWYMAWDAVDVVCHSAGENPNITISPLITPEVRGLSLGVNW